jgi:deoxyribodipyrimidine photo-lyase
MDGGKIVIHWFRQDLRLNDNPALLEASASGKVLPIYILDDENAGKFKMGGASRWWLHHSLQSLNESLNGNLAFYIGDANKVLLEITSRLNVKAVYWNRCYEPWRIQRDKVIKETLQKKGIEAQSFNGSLLWEPWENLKEDGTPYKVFTPFYRKGCIGKAPPRQPLPMPEKLSLINEPSALKLSSLALLPKIRWDEKIKPNWQIGEKAGQSRLYEFLAEGIEGYKEGRNFPAKPNVSRLSPYLHFGEVSPHQVWHAANIRGNDINIDHYCSELGWREFSYSLLYHNPDLPHKNLQPKFDRFPWCSNSDALRKWQLGQTGYPIVDAGMRELWQTGYMHNRVRMIVASFLVKNLLLDWRHGERWFWDCLVDADLANNSAGWQWVAGCGADAAPYFRIFNPVTQGEKFDPNGKYTRCFVPELNKLPDRYLFKPWEAPDSLLKEAGVYLGRTYPIRMVDITQSRNSALKAFSSLKDGTME